MERDKKQHKHWPNKLPLYPNHRTNHEPRSVFPPLSSKFDLFHIYRTTESMLLTTILLFILSSVSLGWPRHRAIQHHGTQPFISMVLSFIKCSLSVKRHIFTSVGRTGLFVPLSLDFWWFLPPCTTLPVPAMCVSLDYWHWSQLT